MDIKTKASAASKKTVREVTNPVRQNLWLTSYFLLGAICLLIYFLLRLKVFNIGRYEVTILKLLLAGATSFGALIISRFIQGIVSKRSHTKAIRYNIIRLIKLITFIIIAFIFITYLNSNWYTAAVSLGLISLLLGFALQTPIASLIGWFYLVIRTPYKVGDRIQVSQFTDDVVEINYFDTPALGICG